MPLNANEMVECLNGIQWKEYRKTATVKAVQMDEPFTVDTLEHEGLQGKAGDYLCQGIKGELWPVDREVFESTYEEVNHES